MVQHDVTRPSMPRDSFSGGVGAAAILEARRPSWTPTRNVTYSSSIPEE